MRNEYINLLKGVVLDNKYTRWYINIITNALTRFNTRSEAKAEFGYSEYHHIVPESFFINRVRKGPKGILEGDPEHKDNKVYLSAKEHFICHWLLVKVFNNTFFRIRAEYAFIGFAFDKNGERKLNSREYDIIRKYKAKTNTETQKKLVSEGLHPFQQEVHKQATSLRSTERGKRLMELGEHPFQTESVKAKNIATNKQKTLNGTHVFQQESVRKKARIAIDITIKEQIENGTYVLQRDEVKQKSRERAIDRNLNNNPNNLPHVKEMRSGKMKNMNLPFFSILETKKTYNKGLLSKNFPEFKEYY